MANVGEAFFDAFRAVSAVLVGLLIGLLAGMFAADMFPAAGPIVKNGVFSGVGAAAAVEWWRKTEEVKEEVPTEPIR